MAERTIQLLGRTVSGDGRWEIELGPWRAVIRSDPERHIGDWVMGELHFMSRPIVRVESSLEGVAKELGSHAAGFARSITDVAGCVKFTDLVPALDALVKRGTGT
jgi:hypothetical protein